MCETQSSSDRERFKFIFQRPMEGNKFPYLSVMRDSSKALSNGIFLSSIELHVRIQIECMAFHYGKLFKESCRFTSPYYHIRELFALHGSMEEN